MSNADGTSKVGLFKTGLFFRSAFSRVIAPVSQETQLARIVRRGVWFRRCWFAIEIQLGQSVRRFEQSNRGHHAHGGVTLRLFGLDRSVYAARW
jgi:hypothetical protein